MAQSRLYCFNRAFCLRLFNVSRINLKKQNNMNWKKTKKITTAALTIASTTSALAIPQSPVKKAKKLLVIGFAVIAVIEAIRS